MQVYRHMDTGTAKPTLAEQEEVPHHLLDLVEPTEEHNLALFLVAAREAVAGIESRGADALLVGGTGLYVRGIVDDLDPPGRYPEVVERLEPLTDDELSAELAEVDPVSHVRCAGNRRRMMRALEVTVGSGVAFSEHGGPLESYSETPFVLCGVSPPRPEMATRIAARYEEQLAAGLVGEAEYLHGLGETLSRTAAQALGYRELLSWLRGEVGFEEAMGQARTRTRRFAVRQVRWFRRDPRIRWFEAPRDPAGVDASAEALDVLWRKSLAGGVGSVATVGDPAAPPADGSRPSEEVQ